MNLSIFRRSVAVWQESVWLLCSLAGATMALFGLAPALFAFAAWSISGAVIGYSSAVAQHLRLLPLASTPSRVPLKTALAFAADYVVGSGSAQVSFNIVGAIGGLAAVGTLRAASTLLGPVGIVVASARTLAIPYLARRQDKGATTREQALSGTVAIAVLVVPILAFVAFLPAPIGELLLGNNYHYAALVLPLLAVEMLFTALTTMPFAGYRALMAGKESLLIRSGLAIVRIAATTIAALVGGAIAAATVFAVMAAVGSLIWWVAYLRKLAKDA